MTVTTSRVLVTLGLALAAAPRAAAAQPACVPGTVSSYAALGAGGCRIGTLTFALPRVGPADPTRGPYGLAPILRTIGGRSYAGLHVTAVPAFSLTVPNSSSVLGIAFAIPFSATGAGVDRVRVDALDATATSADPLTTVAAAGVFVGPLAFTSTGLQRIALAGAPAVTRCYTLGLAGDVATPCLDPEQVYDPALGGTLDLGLRALLPTGASPDAAGDATLASFDLLFRTGAVTTAAPEPATLALVAAGLLAIGAATPRGRRGARWSSAAPAGWRAPAAAAAARRAGAPTA